MSKTMDYLEYFYQYAKSNDCLNDELTDLLKKDKTKKKT